MLALPTNVDAKSFSDVYDPSFRGQASIGYGIGPRSEVFLSLVSIGIGLLFTLVVLQQGFAGLVFTACDR